MTKKELQAQINFLVSELERLKIRKTIKRGE